jgi:two-component system sensor histidine kinase ChvG
VKLDLRTSAKSLWRFASRIWIRLLAFNILLVFLPIAGLFYFETYETKLLEAQERSMVQQGRLLAAALGGSVPLDATAQSILDSLSPRNTTRFRVLDRFGNLVADSSMGIQVPEQTGTSSGRDVRSYWLYRLGKTLFRLGEGIATIGPFKSGSAAVPPADGSIGPAEVRRALSGRYGATWRVSPDQRSVTLFSAVPVWRENEVAGAVIVSQSTLNVLLDLYDIRLTVFQIILVSLLAAAILSLVVGKTIAAPLQDLRRKASRVLDRRVALKDLFQSSNRRDEIGDLTRSLEDLSRRLHDRVQFIESFASDLSHELKNPLASIRTTAELLKQVDDPEERGRFLSLVETDVVRMERLLSRVREITLLDASLQDETRDEVYLDKFLQVFTKGFELRREAKVKLEVADSASKPRVMVSPDRLSQIFENLLDNALSFSPRDSEIQVQLHCENGIVCVIVRDQGPGIPREHLGRVFDRFFSHRPSESKATSHHVGLGLAIAKTIVEGYGGTITARNAEGQGAVFEVRLRAVAGNPLQAEKDK